MTDAEREITKLTLTVDKHVILEAKKKSLDMGFSLSKVVEQFLKEWVKK